jgi:hypothetical protein
MTQLRARSPTRKRDGANATRQNSLLADRKPLPAPGPADIGAGALIKPEAWTPRLQKLRKKLREERRLARLDWRVKR